MFIRTALKSEIVSQTSIFKALLESLQHFVTTLFYNLLWFFFIVLKRICKYWEFKGYLFKLVSNLFWPYGSYFPLNSRGVDQLHIFYFTPL